MDFRRMPKAAIIILLTSFMISLIVTGFPEFSEYLAFKIGYFMPLNILTGVFFTEFNIQFLLASFMRFQILSAIEKIEENDVEILFYTTLFVFPLLLSNLLEGVRSFDTAINMAYVYMLSQAQDEFDIFGVSLRSQFIPYVYLIFDFLISSGRSKAYYGFLHGFVFFKLKYYELITVPDLFCKLYQSLWTRTTKSRVFRGKGHRLGPKK